MTLDRKGIENYLQTEGGGRYELVIRPSDGLIVVNFYNRHGSLFDVVDATDFELATVAESK